MILPRSHTWMHLMPAGASYECRALPDWFCAPLQSNPAADAPRLLVTGSPIEASALSNHDGVVCVDTRGPSDADLRRQGFTYVRRFAVLPNLREARWFIPLDSAAVASSAFCLYTPYRVSARLKVAAARAAIRAHLPLWYRHQICLATRLCPPLDSEMQDLFPGTPVRLALSSGAIGPETRRKPSVAVLGTDGQRLAFAKIAGSEVARHLLEREARVLPALSSHPRTAALAPALLMAGEIDGTMVLAQSPIIGRQIPMRWSPAHDEFLEALQSPQMQPAADSEIITDIRDLATKLPVDAAGMLAMLDDVLRLLRGQMVPRTITHADFVTWNLRMRDGRLAAFDWDTAILDGLPLYDRIHYHLMVGYCINDLTVKDASNYILALAEQSPLGLRSQAVRAIAIVYLIHHALKLQMQGHAAEHPMTVWYREILACVHSAYVKNVGHRPAREGFVFQGAAPEVIAVAGRGEYQ